MQLRSIVAFVSGLALGLGAAVAPAHSADAAPSRVYGVEIEGQGALLRVLVFADATVEYRVEEPDSETVVLRIADAVLDRTTPRRVAPRVSGPVSAVRAVERSVGSTPEVRVIIERTSGAVAAVSQRGGTLAVDFERREVSDERGMVFQFQATEISEIVRAVAAATGESFLFDEQLRGPVSILIAERVSSSEAIEVLNVALLMRGFAAIPSPSGVRKIVKIGEAPSLAPWLLAEPDTAHEGFVTTLVHFDSTDVDTIAAALRELVGAAEVVQPYAPTNSLILAGVERRLQRLIGVARALDQAAQQELIVRRLEHRAASDAAELLLEVVGQGAPLGLKLEVWPEERTNAVVVRVSPELADQTRVFLDRIDAPLEGRGEIQVIRLRHADATELAALVAALGAGTGSPASAAPGRGAGGADRDPRIGESLLGRDYTVVADDPTNSLVVRTDPDTFRLVRSVVAELDRPPTRVSVEVMLLEVTTAQGLDLSFDAFIPIAEPKDPGDLIANVGLNPRGGGLVDPAFLPPSAATPAGSARFTREPLILPFVDADGNLVDVTIPRETAVVTADEVVVRARVLLRPQLMMISGSEDEIFAGDNIPIRRASTQQGATVDPIETLQVRQDIERQDVGVRLRLQPTVGERGDVRLELDLDTTRLAPSLAGDVADVGPTLRQRRLTATIYLNHGEIAVLGTGREPSYQSVVTGTPFLMRIPVLGALFRRTSEIEFQTELVITAQARVLRSPDQDLAESIRRRAAFERQQARHSALRVPPEAPYALLLTSTPSSAEAREIAEDLREQGWLSQVSAWQSGGAAAFDVYVVGFTSLAEAARASLPLTDAGFTPQVEVILSDLF